MKNRFHVFSRMFARLTPVNMFLLILFAVFAVPSVWALPGEGIGRQGAGATMDCSEPFFVSPTNGVTQFYLYDDGGPNGSYSNNCNTYIEVRVPEGYVIKLSGTIKAERYDYLVIKDGDASSTEYIAQRISGSGIDTTLDIGSYNSSGNKMTVYFITDGSVAGDGLRLRVDLVPLYKITLQQPEGSRSSIWVRMPSGENVREASWLAGDTVHLGYTTPYYLQGIRVTDANGNLVKVVYESENRLSFVMPASAVTVIPTMSSSGGTINMLNGERRRYISNSIMVYDDGDFDKPYTNNFDGWLTIWTELGYYLKVTGSVETEAKGEYIYDYLEIYDGEKGASTTPICKVYSRSGSSTTTVDVPSNCKSSGEYLTIHFHSDESNTASGLDLTVSSELRSYSVAVKTASNGRITSDVSSATKGSTITLTAVPNSGYVLKSVNVVNKVTGTTVATSGGWETNNKVTFTMPAGNVEVTPTFVTDTYSITKKSVTGGSVSGVSSAKVGNTVTLTANLSSGYLFKGVSVVDANGNSLNVSGGKGFSDRTFSFTMPIGNVTVTPSFTNNLTADGGLYIDMPTTGKVNATIPAGVKSFKIYDDGGKDGSYSNSSSGTLVLTAPSGYVFQLSGSVRTYYSSSNNAYDKDDYLTVCDGADTTMTKLVYKEHYTYNDINVYSSSRNMVLFFHSGSSDNTSGLDLTVTLHKLDMDLVDDGNAGKYVNMLPNGIATLEIPEGVTSFKVYDDGGKSGNYNNRGSGTLVLKAPSNHVLQLSGNVKTYYSNSTGSIVYDTDDYLTVCDGADTNKTRLVNKEYGSNSIIDPVYSSGQYMTLYFHSNDYNNSSGLDLTVSVIPVENQITYANSNSGGTVLSSSPKKANIGAAVNFTYEYNNGYLVNDIKVVAESGEAVKAFGGWFNNKKASFEMPHGGVTVTSTYTNNLTADGGLYIDMPTTGTVNATIPADVKSFKIYDDGGKNGNYSKSSNGTLILIAPENHVFQLTGTVKTGYTDRTGYTSGTYNYTCNSEDNLSVYDGNGSSASSLVSGRIGCTTGSGLSSGPSASAITKTLTTGRYMTLNFKSNLSGFASDGLDLTVTLVNLAVDLADDGNGGKYVNMLPKNVATLEIPSGVTSFKVYDDGGKSGDYSNSSSGTLVLKAPIGHVVQLSGSVNTYWNSSSVYDTEDYLTVCNGGDTTKTKLVDKLYGKSRHLDTVYSSGQYMTLYFHSNGYNNASGLDLTARVIPVENQITYVNANYGGSILSSSPMKAKIDSTANFTYDFNSGYLVSDIKVVAESGEPVKAVGGWYNNKKASFKMPHSGVTVTSTYTNNLTADGGLYIDMPTTGILNATIPNGVTSFKVYDDGGKDGNYSNSSSGTLVLTAPSGYLLQLSGSVRTYYKSGNHDTEDYLTVCDGADTNKTRLVNKMYGSNSSIDKVYSSGRSMTLYFHSNDGDNAPGFDLTVNVLSGESRGISLEASPHGSVVIDKSSAVVGTVVTLTANSDDGYLLKSISVNDKNGNSVGVFNPWSSANNLKTFPKTFTYSFVMPESPVVVTPVFTKNLTVADGIYYKMPERGRLDVTIPNAVKSFKVEGCNVYSDYCNGVLALSAPEGYRFKLEGKIDLLCTGDDSFSSSECATIGNQNYFSAFDGLDTTIATKLLNEQYSPINGSILSSGRFVSLYLYTGFTNYKADALNLKVTLVPNTYAISVKSATGGSVTSSKSIAGVDDDVTLTATPANGYLLDGMTVENENGESVAMSKDMYWYSGNGNKVTFTMPNAAVTVTPTFTKLSDLYVNMPKTGTINATIPEGVGSFKVYDEGGVNGAYSNNSDGSIVFTAPTGYLLKLTGTVIAERNYDKLYVYNGSAVNENNLLATIPGKATGSSVNEKADVGTIVSSGERMTVRFTSDGSQYYSGLNLTMTLVKSIANMTVADISSKMYTGSAICPDVVVKDGDAVLVKNTDYTVTCSDNINVGTATVTITGIGDYTGTVSKQFSIIPKVVNDFAAVTIEQDENGTFAVIDGNYSGTDVVEIKNEIKDVPVVYNRSFPANAYSTIMLPFDVNTANIEGPDAVLRYNGIKDNSSIRMKVVWATEEWALANGITGKSYAHTDLSANTPYLVQMGDATSEDGKTVALKVNGAVTLKKTADTATAINGWKFRGTWQYKRWDANDDELGYAYGFAASASETNNIKVGDFVKVGVGAWIRPMRAYLVKDGITKKSAQLARANGAYVKRPTVVPEELPELMSIVIDGDDDNEEHTTVIGHFNTRTGEIKMNYDRGKFDLKGRRVNGSNNARGAYYGKKATVRRPER